MEESKAHPHKTVWHRALGVLVISILSFVGLETLVYINNLYQPQIYIETAAAIYLVLVIWLHFLFDLHFRDREHFTAKKLWHAIGRRLKHFAKWEHLRYFQNYMILPGILYWGAIILIGINFRHYALQQFIAIAAGAALVIDYSLFKEIFRSRLLPVAGAHFVVMVYVKLFAAWLIYTAALGIVWYYCFSPGIYHVAIFLVTLMLLYQALFQFSEMRLRNVAYVIIISALLSLSSYFIYRYWNVNYFTAGLLMAAVYNFLWMLLYHKLKNALTWRVFFEQLALLILVAAMVFGVTDFKSKIQRC